MTALLKTYFDAFNAKDTDAMLACLSDDVAHHVNEGQIRTGKDKFAAFCGHMNRCYREQLTDMVIFATPDGTRAAAEYIVNGTYLAYEYDLGEEQISLGNIIRDSSIARKFLVYEQVEQSGVLDALDWGPRIYPMVVNTRKNTKKSSRARIKTMIEAMPPQVRASRFYFIDQQTHDAAGDDVAQIEWMRGDGRVMRLPCWG